MKLLKEGQIQLLEKAEEAVKYINSSDVEKVAIYTLNEENLHKYPLDQIYTFKIKGEDGVGNVILAIKLTSMSSKSDNMFVKIRAGIIAMVLTYFSEERGNITEKVQYLLDKKLG